MKPEDIAKILTSLTQQTQPVIDLRRLAEPFPADAVSWRVGSTTKDKTKGMALAYIDARDVMDRLDQVAGADWQDKYEAMPDGSYCCSIGIKIDGEWRWRSDGALMLTDSDKIDAKEMAQKGSYSDAFKRAAVKWGIGRYLYSLDSPWVKIEARGTSYVISDEGRSTLRNVLMKQAKAFNPGQETGAPQPSLSQPKPKEAPAQERPSPPATARTTETGAAAVTDAVASPSIKPPSRADAIPTVEPAKLKPKPESWKERERIQFSKGATDTLLGGVDGKGGLAFIRAAVGISKVEIVETQFAEWRKRADQAWKRIVDEDKGRITDAVREFKDALETEKVETAAISKGDDFDRETGEIREAAE